MKYQGDIIKNINLLMTLSSVLILVGCGGGGSVAATPTTNAPLPVSTAPVAQPTINPYPANLLSDSEKSSYLAAINNARSSQKDCGSKGIYPAVTALQWSSELYSSAAEHSYDMATSNTFSHNGSGTASDWTGMDIGSASTVTNRIENNGYTNWTKNGENIAAGTNLDDEQKVVDGWLASDDHCAVLMNSSFTEVGMAMVSNVQSTYVNYWTQNFGSRQ